MKDFLLLCLLLLQTACSKENEEEFVSFNLSTSVVSLDSSAQTCEINIESNVNWNVLNPAFLPEWLSVEKVDETKLRIEVEENQTVDSRRSRVYFDIAKDSCFLDVRQDSKKYLSFRGKKEYLLNSRKDSLVVDVETNVLFNVMIFNSNNWISTSWNLTLPFLFDNTLVFDIKGNTEQVQREAFIVISNDEYQLSDTLIVKQMPKTSVDISDGEYKILQKSSKGRTNLIVMGDGFTVDSLEDGYYNDCMSNAVEHFFSIEPYKSYHEYFNVYMVVAESEEEGVGEKDFLGKGTINNKFGTAFGDGTEIIGNNELIFEYARKIKELPEGKPITVLVVLNSDKYAGTAYLIPMEILSLIVL